MDNDSLESALWSSATDRIRLTRGSDMVRDRSCSAMKEQIRTFCVQTRSAMEGPISVVVTVAPGNEDVCRRALTLASWLASD